MEIIQLKKESKETHKRDLPCGQRAGHNRATCASYKNELTLQTHAWGWAACVLGVSVRQAYWAVRAGLLGLHVCRGACSPADADGIVVRFDSTYVLACLLSGLYSVHAHAGYMGCCLHACLVHNWHTELAVHICACYVMHVQLSVSPHVMVNTCAENKSDVQHMVFAICFKADWPLLGFLLSQMLSWPKRSWTNIFSGQRSIFHLS